MVLGRKTNFFLGKTKRNYLLGNYAVLEIVFLIFS